MKRFAIIPVLVLAGCAIPPAPESTFNAMCTQAIGAAKQPGGDWRAPLRHMDEIEIHHGVYGDSVGMPYGLSGPHHHECLMRMVDMGLVGPPPGDPGPGLICHTMPLTGGGETIHCY